MVGMKLTMVNYGKTMVVNDTNVFHSFCCYRGVGLVFYSRNVYSN